MENKLRIIYDIENFKGNKDGKLRIEISKNIEELANDLGISLDSDNFDEYLRKYFSFVSNLTEAFKNILNKEGLMIYSEKGRIILGN